MKTRSKRWRSKGHKQVRVFVTPGKPTKARGGVYSLTGTPIASPVYTRQPAEPKANEFEESIIEDLEAAAELEVSLDEEELDTWVPEPEVDYNPELDTDFEMEAEFNLEDEDPKPLETLFTPNGDFDEEQIINSEEIEEDSLDDNTFGSEALDGETEVSSKLLDRNPEIRSDGHEEKFFTETEQTEAGKLCEDLEEETTEGDEEHSKVPPKNLYDDVIASKAPKWPEPFIQSPSIDESTAEEPKLPRSTVIRWKKR